MRILKTLALVVGAVFTGIMLGQTSPARANTVNNYIIDKVNNADWHGATEITSPDYFAVINYLRGDYGKNGSDYGFRKGVKKPEGVVVHETANTSDGNKAAGEIAYMVNNYESAFVHGFVTGSASTKLGDNSGSVALADTNYLAWGAGPTANSRYLQTEQVRVSSKNQFAQELLNLATTQAAYLKQYGLKPTLGNTSTKKGTVWSHQMTSKAFGETDHTDPDGYWRDSAKKWFGTTYTMNDYFALLSKVYANELQGKDTLTNEVTVSQTAIINATTRNDGLYLNAPYNVKGATRYGSTKTYNKLTVVISKTAQIKKPDGTKTTKYAYISLNGKNVWVDLAGLKIIQTGKTTLINQKTTNLVGTISTATRSDGIYSGAPYSVAGAKNVGNTKSYNGVQVWISKTAQTRLPTGKVGATFAYVKLNNAYYWIDMNAFTNVKTATATLINQKTVSQTAIIDATKRADGLYLNAPYGLATAQRYGGTKSYNATTVTVTRYAQVRRADLTAGATFALINLNGQQVWVDQLALRSITNGIATLSNVKQLAKTVTIDASQRADGIYANAPYGISQAKRVGITTSYNQLTVVADQQATVRRANGTTGATFIHLKINGAWYWVDIRAVE